MVAANKQITSDSNGNYSLSNLKSSQVARVDIVDVDLVITDQSGQRYVLENLAVASMREIPPSVAFSDQQMVSSELLKNIGLTTELIKDDIVQTSEEVKPVEEESVSLEEQQELKEKLEELQEKIEEQQEKIEVQQKEIKESKESAQKTPQTNNTEGALEELVEKAEKVQENLHTSDHEYVPPPAFNPPSNPPPSAPGVPPPVSLTPVVTINIGNSVGTTVSGSNIYGGGGAAGTGADAEIGPRNPLQFSAATITGTAGNDVIYTNGPVTGNADPTADRSKNAKEIVLNVAGYFTSLDSIVIEGVPTGGSIQGGSDAGGGRWMLPSSYGIDGTPFLLIYDMDAWRGGSDTFDMNITVSGLSTRGVTFTTTQTFRFMYMDVTSVSDVTDNTLVYDVRGITKQIYVLPTADQPNIINSDDGNDTIYASRSHDTITVGNGDNLIYAYGGDDVITTGTGDNTIHLGEGDNTLTALGGDEIVTAGDGDNTVDLGDGTNQYTAGNGVNNVTGGAGIDTITVGSGNATILAGAGNNIITMNGGVVSVTSGSGNDTISAVGGSGSINSGDGINSITVTSGDFTISSGSGNDTIIAGDGDNIISTGDGTNSVTVGDGGNQITGGGGNDTFVAGNGDNTFSGGLGTNSFTAGTGNNTVDYSIVTTTMVSVDLLAGTATGTGLNESFTNIQNVIGSTSDDTIFGNASANSLSGGSGHDYIEGGNGNDTFYGGDGDDTLIGGSGNDIIYGGNGDNYMETGAAGTDVLYGGSGNNTFYSQHAGVTYNGTNSAVISAGVYNTVDYSADTAGMTINLLSGLGTGGLANGDVYVLSPTSGVNTINMIIGGTGNDTITDSNGDNYLDGRAGTNVFNIYNGTDVAVGGTGQDQFITYGTGAKTYTGNGGTNYYDLGSAAESVVTGGGWDALRYNRSNIGVIINLDNASHSVVNSLGATINLAANTGAGWGATAADAGSYAIGDTFSGNSMNYFWGSTGNDVLWDYSAGGALEFDGNSGVDYFFGGSGNSLIRLTDNDRLDGGGGSGDIIFSNTNNATFMYLDGTADINLNGTADYLERGIASLTISAGSSPTGVAIAYTGFAQGYGGTDYLKNIEYILGNGGNDTLVGDGSANLINGRNGNNSMYGLGGNDTIYSSQGGVNTIDGGTGTDTVTFTHDWYQEGLATAAYVFMSDGTFFGASDKTTYMTAGNLTYDGMTAGGTFLRLSNVENITGSSLNDVLYGNSSTNTITGNSGDDIIAGQGGADTLYGNAGNDSFYIASADVASVTLIDGGTNTDTVRASGLSVTAGSITGAKFTSIEVLDVRDSASGGSFSMNANDITGLADNGTSSSVNLRLDTGDTFTATVGGGTGALSYLVASSTATNTIYYFYSDAAHAVLDSVNRVAILDVYTGA